jgi:hypothetical protein
MGKRDWQVSRESKSGTVRSLAYEHDLSRDRRAVNIQYRSQRGQRARHVFLRVASSPGPRRSASRFAWVTGFLLLAAAAGTGLGCLILWLR